MNPTCDKNGLFRSMVSNIRKHAIHKSLKMGAGGDKIFVVLLEKLLDLFLLGGLDEPLNSALGLLSLMCQFHGTLKLLPKCFLNYPGNVVQDS